MRMLTYAYADICIQAVESQEGDKCLPTASLSTYCLFKAAFVKHVFT
jgi:hypothetical protein